MTLSGRWKTAPVECCMEFLVREVIENEEVPAEIREDARRLIRVYPTLEPAEARDWAFRSAARKYCHRAGALARIRGSADRAQRHDP